MQFECSKARAEQVCRVLGAIAVLPFAVVYLIALFLVSGAIVGSGALWGFLSEDVPNWLLRR
jgi:hypothetical protein